MLGLQMSIVGLGGIAGPAVGGLPSASSAGGGRSSARRSWRQWLFWRRSWSWIPDGQGLLTGAGVKFDWGGAALSTGALIVFLQAMTWAPTLGYGNPAIGRGFRGLRGVPAVFILHELRSSSPMMDVRLFQRRLFSLGVIASFLNFFGSQSVRFLMPFYLQAVLGLPPTQVGLIIVPGAVCMMITGPLSGRLSDRFGWRWFTVGGLLISTAGLLILSTLRSDSHVAIGVAGMMMQSAGIGIFNAPNNSSILSAVEPSKYGVITGFLNLIRNSGNLCSIAIATAIVTATMGSMGYEPSLASVSAGGGEGLLAGVHVGPADLLLGHGGDHGRGCRRVGHEGAGV